MPSVGKKKFPYTPMGEAAAMDYGQKTGKPVRKKKVAKKMPRRMK